MSPLPFVHGKSTSFKVDDSGGTLRDISIYLDEVSQTRAQEPAETTTFQVAGGAKTFVLGLNEGSFSVKGKFDGTSAATGPDLVLSGLINATATSTFEYVPAGGAVTANNPKYTGEAWMTSYELTSPVADVVTFSAEFQVTGQVTRTTA